MTTSEFIEMLKAEDPSGNSHLRFPEGIPIFVEKKEGYWDGPYSYLDEDNNWVYTTAGNKVDVYMLDIYDFVEKQIDTFNIPEWETVKEKFKFDLGYSIESQRKEREDRILSEAKKAYDEIRSFEENTRKRMIDTALERAAKGWRWFQDMRVDEDTPSKINMHHYYTWKVFHEKGKTERGSNLDQTEAVYRSGLFEKSISEEFLGYYEWKLR